MPKPDLGVGQASAAWVVAIAAVVAVAVSVIALWWTGVTSHQEAAESLDLQCKPRSGPVIVNSTPFTILGTPISQGFLEGAWECVVTNIGLRPLTVVASWVQLENDVFLTTLKVDADEIPIGLDPGNVTVLDWVLQWPLRSGKVVDTLKLSPNFPAWESLADLGVELAADGMDLEGNRGRPLVEGGETTGFVIESRILEANQRLLFHVRTARGMVVSATATTDSPWPP